MNIKGMCSDMTCMNFQFEIGKEYKIDNGSKPLKLCTDTVFHYCKDIEHVDMFYPIKVDHSNRYFEIEVLGKEITDGEKFGSDHIKILREIPYDEILTSLKKKRDKIYKEYWQILKYHEYYRYRIVPLAIRYNRINFCITVLELD